MSNCFSCKKKFGILNLDRKRCRECEQHFCYNCMPTMFGSYCKVCKILNTRPVIHSSIVKIRARELKLYLARRKIQTESCIEKDDLIRCFFKYVSLEPQLKNKRSYTNFKTFDTNRCSSTPNLVETHRDRSNNSFPQTPPARTPHMPRNDASGSGHTLQTNISSATNIHSNDTANAETNTSALINDSTQTKESSNIIDVEHIKLSNIQHATDIQSLSIKQLKELLILNRVDYKGCVEKDELRNKVTQLWKASKDKTDVTNLPVDELCKICMDAPLNSVLLECGHIVSCINCGKQLAECPICRQYVVRVVHTFKA